MILEQTHDLTRTIPLRMLDQAKEHGIEQALVHRVIGGYVNNENLVLDTGEIPPARLPQCLKLVGDEPKLGAYLKNNPEHLSSVRSIFLRGQEAELGAICVAMIVVGIEMERRAG